MPPSQNSSDLLTKVLIGLLGVLLVFIVGGGTYYFYRSGDLNLNFGKKEQAGAPTATPFPTPVKQAVRQEITPETDYGACAELKESPLVKNADLVDRAGEFILVGNLRGRVQNLSIVGEEIVQFDLVPENEGVAKKTLRLKDKADFVFDPEGAIQKLANLPANQVVEVQFNCIRSGTNQNAFIALKLIVDRPETQ